MKFRIIFIFSAMLMSVFFGCSKDDSPSDSLVGEWIGNDSHRITISGDQTTNEVAIDNKEQRPRLVIESNGKATAYYYNEANEAVQDTYTYVLDGDKISMTSQDGETDEYQYTINVYQSLARLTLISKEELPNGTRIEVRDHFIRR